MIRWREEGRHFIAEHKKFLRLYIWCADTDGPKRYGWEILMVGTSGMVTGVAGEPFADLEIEEAKKRLVHELRKMAKGMLRWVGEA